MTVGEVADAHVDAEDVVFIFSRLFLLLLASDCGVVGQSSVGLGEFILEVGDQDRFGAAAVDAGCAGYGFELSELAGVKPVEAGCHPWSFAMRVVTLERVVTASAPTTERIRQTRHRLMSRRSVR